MCITTFFTQKQIMKRSGPVEGQAAMVQKLLLYGMPLSLFVSGFFFPIGVLLYWFTNNLWTLGQQFFILRKLPPPGSDAHKAKAAADKPVVDPKTLAPEAGRQAGPHQAGGRPAEPPAPDDAPRGRRDRATASTADGARRGSGRTRRRRRRRQRPGKAAPGGRAPGGRAGRARPTVASASAADRRAPRDVPPAPPATDHRASPAARTELEEPP